MAMTPVPAVFCWTKMGTESGLSLATILDIKERERQAGQGVFVWGIGSSLSPSAVGALLRRTPTPTVVFSEIKANGPTPPPKSVVQWRTYIDPEGRVVPLPSHVTETFSGPVTRRVYALFCRRRTPIKRRADQQIRLCELHNLLSGKQVGSSQVTSVVEHRPGSCPCNHALEYPVSFVAEWIWPYIARLADPIILPDGRPRATRRGPKTGGSIASRARTPLGRKRRDG